MENEKLMKVQKSSNVIAKVSKALMIIFIVCAALVFVASITLRFTAKLDPDAFGVPGFVVLDESDFAVMAEGKMPVYPSFSSNGLLQFGLEKRDLASAADFNKALSTLLMFVTIIMAGGAVIFGFICKAFKTIVKESTPFSETVMRSVRVSFIVATVITVVLLDVLTGVLLGLFALFVYRILDYGFVLQTLSDETL